MLRSPVFVVLMAMLILSCVTQPADAFVIPFLLPGIFSLFGKKKKNNQSNKSSTQTQTTTTTTAGYMVPGTDNQFVPPTTTTTKTTATSNNNQSTSSANQNNNCPIFLPHCLIMKGVKSGGRAIRKMIQRRRAPAAAPTQTVPIQAPTTPVPVPAAPPMQAYLPAPPTPNGVDPATVGW